MVVLLAEPEPISFLAGVLAAQMRGVALILGNPGWRWGEWQQVQEQVHYTLAWGEVPIPAQRGVSGECLSPRRDAADCHWGNLGADSFRGTNLGPAHGLGFGVSGAYSGSGDSLLLYVAPISCQWLDAGCAIARHGGGDWY